jgi:hypothetical protein
MTTFFKDFSKAPKDLLTKSVAEDKATPEDKAAGRFPAPIWKVESKLKVGDKRQWVVNPVADAKGVSANVEFVVAPVDGLKGKVNVSADVNKWKPTATWECCPGRKVEVNTASVSDYLNGEATYEDQQKSYAAIVKATKSAKDGAKLSVEAAVPVVADVTVGASLDVALTGEKAYKLGKWTAGARYAVNKESVVGFTLAGLESVDVFGATNVPGVQLEGKPVQAGAIVTVNKDKTWGAVIGATGKTPLCPCGSSWKVKFDTNKNVSFSQIFDCSGWKASYTFDVVRRAIGFTATME